LSRAYAKYLQERTVEPNPLEMAHVVVPSDLVRLTAIWRSPRETNPIIGAVGPVAAARPLQT